MIGVLYKFVREAYPPKPTFTENNVPELNGKASSPVYLVTGANTGLGKEVAQILYSQNAKVYVAARSEEKAAAAIEAIKQAFPSSSGELHFLRLDLADLSTIKASAEQFLSREPRLHVLFNNAGVMNPPSGARTAQGYELQLGVNAIGTHMFTRLLTPALVAAAKTEPAGAVRVVWVSSSGAELPVVPTGGVGELRDLEGSPSSVHDRRFWLTQYGVSKAANYLHSAEFARRHKADGVVSVAANPGNLDSELWRTQKSISMLFLRTFALHPTIYGAYTQLFAGLSPEVGMSQSGGWILPWGRIGTLRRDIIDASKSKEEGGTGRGREFWDWTEEQIKPFL